MLICDGIAAFDIDHCISEDGSLNDLAACVLGKFKGCIDSGECYVEVSPSGTGLRGFFSVDGSFDYDKEKYYIKHGNLEIYLPGVTNRFVTVTGNVYHYEGTAESDEGIESAKSGVSTEVCAADGVNETATDPVSALISVLDEHMTRKNAISSLPEDFEPCSFLSDKEVLVKVPLFSIYINIICKFHHFSINSNSYKSLFLISFKLFYKLSFSSSYNR